MDELLSDNDFIKAALENLTAIFTPKQLFYLSVLAQNRKEAGYGSVSFSFWRGTFNGIVEEIPAKPADIPDIVGKLLQLGKD